MNSPIHPMKRRPIFLSHGPGREPRDRRNGRRYARPRLCCYVLAAGGSFEAGVMDLSVQGACLALRERVETGAVLLLHLSNRDHLRAWTVALRVTHCEAPSADCWVVGGPFVEPLPPEALLVLNG